MLLPRTLVPLFEGGEGPSADGAPMVDVGVDGAPGPGAEVEAGEDDTGAILGGEGGDEKAVGLGASAGGPPMFDVTGAAVGGVVETAGGVAGGKEIVDGGVAVVGGGVTVLVGDGAVVVAGGVAVLVGGRAVVVGGGAGAVGGVTLEVLGGLAVELLGADDGP